ncbi:type VI secretion system baseplate subunit TssE [Paraburkholderia jirisanensis]
MRFNPSLFDKLFGGYPTESNPSTVRTHSLDEIKHSVARDLESLLNTRMAFSEAQLELFRECAGSMLTYGLNDFSDRSLASSEDRSFICASIKRAITRHEPRLQGVEVALAVREQCVSVLHFAIKALLVVHPAQAPVNFDALLQPSTHQYSVTRAKGKV